jgi:hypothetical protein
MAGKSVDGIAEIVTGDGPAPRVEIGIWFVGVSSFFSVMIRWVVTAATPEADGGGGEFDGESVPVAVTAGKVEGLGTDGTGFDGRATSSSGMRNVIFGRGFFAAPVSGAPGV